MNKKIAILGSCVTRDMFNFGIDYVTNEDVALFIARTTAVSMMGKSFKDFIKPNIDEIQKFDEKKFFIDLHKSYFDSLLTTDWDVLIIDLIDERHATYCLDGMMLTYTNSSKRYIQECRKKVGGKILKPLSNNTVQLTYDALEKMKLFLLEAGREKTILLHKAKYATHFLKEGKLFAFDNETLAAIKKWNLFLDACYERLLDNSGFIGIEVSDEKIVAGGNHKWDLMPYHYDKSYYDELYDRVSLYMRP